MYSGSAVVDWRNRSGLGADGRPPLVLIYTAAGHPTVQCLAASTDGRAFTKFAGNPVLKQITAGNRDPKVIWHEPSKKWVMTLYVELNKVHTIHFLSSPNLKDWSYLSRTDGFYECPDFFELPVDGEASKKKWVLTAASGEYMVGAFDGTTFTPETPKLTGHRGGRGCYAAQTFSDLPENDGRRIQIGWFRTATPGMPFNQSMTIPLELQLLGTPEGPRLTMNPVKELASLRARSHQVGPLTLRAGDANPLAQVNGELLELRADFEPGATSVVSLNARGVAVSYDAGRQELTVNGHPSPAPLRDGRQRLAIYTDRAALEVFASEGLTYVPMPVVPDQKNLTVQVVVIGDPVKFSSLDAHNLRSIWK
jgi:sucrose-6-phosphate hydrolase SacC (GH32 family)